MVLSVGAFAVPAFAQSRDVIDVSSGWDVRILGRPAPETADLGDTWGTLGGVGYDGVVVLSRSFPIPDGARDWSFLLGPVSFGVVQVVADGVEVARIGGDPGTLPHPRTLLAELPDRVLEDGEVVIELSVHRVAWLSDAQSDGLTLTRDGAWLGPTVELSDRRELAERRVMMDDLPNLIFGILFLIAGAIHLYLFSRGRQRRGSLWLSVGATAFGMNTLALSAWCESFLSTLGFALRVSDASGHLAAVGILAFLFAALAQPIDVWTRRYLWSHAVLAGLVMVVPLSLVWASEELRLLWLLPALVSGFVALRGGIRDGHPESRILLVGVAVFAAAQIGEVLRAMVGVGLPERLPILGFTFMLIAMTIALSGRFLRLHSEKERLTGELEARVLARTADLATAVRAAEDANRAKSQFLANMSHELRTPLNSVIGFSNVLVRRVGRDMEPRDLDFLQRIRVSGEHLLAIVNDILDISRIEAGSLEINPQEVDVRTVVREAVAFHQAEAERKTIRLGMALPADEAISLVDPDRLKQVLQNVIGNAVKFTHEGSVEVRLLSDGGVATDIEVVDTGLGIPTEKLEDIFRPFEQVDSSMSRSYHGTGLGLTLSRALCELMGCSLEAESVVDAGSTFRVGLAIMDVSGRNSVDAVGGSVQVGPGPGRHVLVIDDDSDARLLLAETLGELGCTVTFARSGEEGLQSAKELLPDLITLDLHMPGLDGWETLRRLREDPGLSEVPVMIVSVSGSQAAGESGNLLGDVDVLDKPVAFHDLERVVQKHLGPDPGRILVVDDDAGVRAMMEEMLDGVDAEVRTAGDGLEALEVLQDFNPGLIFLDLIMPRMGGMELLARLRSHPKYAETPIIVVTSKELSASEERVLAENTQAVVGKGGDGDLRNRLKTFFRAE